jgi:hypothetical protein
MDTGDKVEFAQDPHRPSSVRATIAYTPDASDTTNSIVTFDVFTTGDIKNADGVLDCDATTYTNEETEALGKIFHPLREERNGVVNPYADPARGLIANKAYDGTQGIAVTDVQTDLLMDLGGADSLIGRALFVG